MIFCLFLIRVILEILDSIDSKFGHIEEHEKRNDYFGKSVNLAHFYLDRINDQKYWKE